jgi:hypothetical protein
MESEKQAIRCSYSKHCTKTSKTDKFFNEIEHICEDCQADKDFETGRIRSLIDGDPNFTQPQSLVSEDKNQDGSHEKVEEVEEVTHAIEVGRVEQDVEINLTAMAIENKNLLIELNNKTVDKSKSLLFSGGLNSITINGINHEYIEDIGKSNNVCYFLLKRMLIFII